MKSKKDLTWRQALSRNPKLNPLGDADRDGRLNMFDCRPFDKKRDGVFILSQLSQKKRAAILNNKKYLYHKTEHSNIRGIVEKGTLQNQPMGGKPFSMSEDSNPTVVHKEYKKPVVIVLERKKLHKLKKLDYDNPETFAPTYPSEKEWLAEGSTRKALRGIIFNEKSGPQGAPSRYITEEDMIKTKFKR